MAPEFAMPRSERSEKYGKAPPYPEGKNFAKLLDWHLNFGTRPTGTLERRGTPWGNVEFGQAVAGAAVATETYDRNTRNWRSGRSRPQDLRSIERELFGDNPAYDDWRLDLRAAYDNRSSVTGVEPPCAEFLGRDEDIRGILDVLLASGAPRSILVQGPPGIGKTELTKAVAHHPAVAEHFGTDRRWFVALETATTAALMQDAVTRAVGADPKGGFKATLAHLRQKSGLLVLDNLETPWDPVAERRAVETTLAELAAFSDVALLASFRGHDRVGGARWTLVHRVERLRPPFDAELFGRVAQRSFAADPHFASFLTALDGVPLAIELVARRAFGTATLARLWAQWTAVGAELAVNPDYEAGRLTSLPHSIKLSLASSRMTASADRLFRLLGQLPAGLVEEDRDHLLGTREGFGAEEALRRLGLVVERGLRLDMLSPIREFARLTRTPEPPDDIAWPTRYLDLTKRLGEAIGTEAGVGAVRRLEPEFANISAAIKVSLPDHLTEAMAARPGFYRLTSIAAIPAPVLQDMADACGRADDHLGEANSIFSLGDIALGRSDHDAARAAFEQALPLYRQVGDLLGEANCIQSLGDIALRRSDHDAARAAYEQALPLYRKVGDLLGEAHCIFSFGDIALRRSDHDAARAAYEQALPLYRKVGDLLGEANSIQSLGDIALRRSDHDAARAAYEQALPLYRKVGALLGEANCIFSFGDIALRCSDYDAARAAYEQALSFYRKVGDLLGEAHCIFSFGEIALHRSDHDAARAGFEQALPLYRNVGSVLGEANCIHSVGDIALRLSDYDTASAAFEQALPLYRKVGALQGEANCILRFGNIALARSDHDAARTGFEQALPIYRKVGDVQGEANCIARLKALG